MKLRAELTVVNMTMRAELAGNETGAIASDIKLSGEVKLAQVEQLFSTPAGFKLLESMYQGNDELAVTEYGEFSITREVAGVKADLESTFGGSAVKFAGGEFNNITLKALPGRKVLFTGRLQVHPTKEQWGEMTTILKQTVDAHIRGKWLEPDEDEPKEKQLPLTDKADDGKKDKVKH